MLTLFILALALCAGRRQGVCCIQMAYRRLALASSEGQAVALHPAPWGSNVHSRRNVPRHLQLVRAKCHSNNLHIDCNIPITYCSPTCPRRALLLQMPSLNTLNAYVYAKNLPSVSNEPFSILLTCNVVFGVWCLVTTHSHVHTARTTLHVHAAYVHPRDTVTAGVSWQGQSAISLFIKSSCVRAQIAWAVLECPGVF